MDDRILDFIGEEIWKQVLLSFWWTALGFGTLLYLIYEAEKAWRAGRHLAFCRAVAGGVGLIGLAGGALAVYAFSTATDDSRAVAECWTERHAAPTGSADEVVAEDAYEACLSRQRAHQLLAWSGTGVAGAATVFVTVLGAIVVGVPLRSTSQLTSQQ